MILCISTVNKAHQKIETNNELILSIVCVGEPDVASVSHTKLQRVISFITIRTTVLIYFD